MHPILCIHCGSWTGRTASTIQAPPFTCASCLVSGQRAPEPPLAPMQQAAAGTIPIEEAWAAEPPIVRPGWD